MTSERLQALASFVPANAVLADVCCDHAKIPLYLLQHGCIQRAIACDLRSAPLEAAKRARDALGFQEEQLSLRQGDGLSPLCIGEADVLLISGIGGRLMIEILSQHISMLTSFDRLILSPQRHLFDVRNWLSQHLYFEDERVVQEGQKWYEIMVLRPGQRQGLTSAECYFGPRLLRKDDRETRAYFSAMRVRDERLMAIQPEKSVPCMDKCNTTVTLADLWAKWEREQRCIE